jgi:ABC-2 type transport system permease protein
MSDIQSVPAGARSDVIHDIGYRHYEGPRLGRGYATRSLYTQGLRGCFGLGRSAKSKILPMTLAAIIAVPALIMVAVAIYLKLKHLPIEYTRYLSIMQFVIAVFTAAQAPVLLSRDLRFMTVPLYFSRPLTSGDYVRAKFAAMVSAIFLLTAMPVLIMWIGSVLGSMDFGYNTARLGYGLLAAALYALLYGGIGTLVASLTPRRGFGVAAIIAVFLVTSAIAGIVYVVLQVHYQNGAVHGPGPFRDDPAANWAWVISPAQLVDNSVTWLFGLERGPRDSVVPSATGGVFFLVEIAALVTASYALLVRRYRKL